MQTAGEAIAFFQSKGFPASLFNYPVDGTIRVSAKEDKVGAKYYGEAIGVLNHTFLLFPDGQAWILRDCDSQGEIDERFDSLQEATSAIAEHLAEWLADGGNSPIGRNKHRI